MMNEKFKVKFRTPDELREQVIKEKLTDDIQHGVEILENEMDIQMHKSSEQLLVDKKMRFVLSQTVAEKLQSLGYPSLKNELVERIWEIVDDDLAKAGWRRCAPKNNNYNAYIIIEAVHTDDSGWDMK